MKRYVIRHRPSDQGQKGKVQQRNHRLSVLEKRRDPKDPKNAPRAAAESHHKPDFEVDRLTASIGQKPRQA